MVPIYIAIILFHPVNILQVLFSVLTIKEFVVLKKCLFCDVQKVIILLEDTCLPTLLGNPLKCSTRAVNQKIVTAQFSGNVPAR